MPEFCGRKDLEVLSAEKQVREAVGWSGGRGLTGRRQREAGGHRRCRRREKLGLTADMVLEGLRRINL